MTFEIDILVDQIARIIESREAELRLEQAVYGIDSLDELQIQSLIAEGLKNHYSVAREVHYPGSIGNKLSHRARCDIVLTPQSHPLRLDHAPPSLFDPTNFTLPTNAFWLEVKCAFQFRAPDERHPGYGEQWRNKVVDDLRKMENDQLIRHAGLLLIVFTESNEIVEKDLQLFEDILVRKEVLAGFRQVRSIKISDRIGHRVCTIALWPTIQR